MPSTALSRRQAAAPVGVPAPSAWRAPAGDAAVLLRALAHADRLRLLCQLVGGERSVGDLGALAGLAQPSLSQQLGVLRAERLVAARREGRQVFYRIASPPAQAVLETLQRLFRAPDSAPDAVPNASSKAPRAARKKVS
jgi:ArsR family transcriptional regulator